MPAGAQPGPGSSPLCPQHSSWCKESDTQWIERSCPRLARPHGGARCPSPPRDTATATLNPHNRHFLSSASPALLESECQGLSTTFHSVTDPKRHFLKKIFNEILSWLRTQLSEGNQGLPSAWPFVTGSITLHIRPGTIVHFSEGKADALDVEPLNPRTSSGRAGLTSRAPKYGCLSVSHGLP